MAASISSLLHLEWWSFSHNSANIFSSASGKEHQRCICNTNDHPGIIPFCSCLVNSSLILICSSLSLITKFWFLLERVALNSSHWSLYMVTFTHVNQVWLCCCCYLQRWSSFFSTSASLSASLLSLNILAFSLILACRSNTVSSLEAISFKYSFSSAASRSLNLPKYHCTTILSQILCYYLSLRSSRLYFSFSNKLSTRRLMVFLWIFLSVSISQVVYTSLGIDAKYIAIHLRIGNMHS